MDECLTTERIRSYARRRVGSAAEVKTIDAHLAECVTCREAVYASLGSGGRDRLTAWVSAPLEPLCPDDRLLARYVDDGADGLDTELVDTHVESCERCRSAVEGLRTLRDEMRQYDWGVVQKLATEATAPARPRTATGPPLRRRLLVPAAALTAAAGAGLATFWFTTRPLRQQNRELRDQVAILQAARRIAGRQVSAGRSLEQELAALRRRDQATQSDLANAQTTISMEQARVNSLARNIPIVAAPLTVQQVPQQPHAHVALCDGTANLLPGAHGGFVRVVPLPAAVAEALRTGTVTPPDEIAQLSRGPRSLPAEVPNSRIHALRAIPDQSRPLRLIEPIGTAVLSDRPAFSWQPVPRATTYSVVVDDEAGHILARAEAVSGPSWTPTTGLTRGHVYRWTVSALQNGGEIASGPLPPAPPARFAILSQAAAAELETETREYAGSPLSLGVVYARAGLMAKAERQFQILVQQNPESPIARRLLAAVEAARAPGQAR